ncbi:MAG: cytochrome b/b6 domain-containing protein [Pseudomonadales bacterium]|nr:cytochrome b/b6 domain-containing protein [Pseudomonadales bacterium]
MKSTTDSQRIYVWDPFIRIFHWTLVLAFATSYLSGEENTDLHVWSGYLICALIVLRLIWGFMGSRHARFTDFIRPPGEAITYLKALASPDPMTKSYIGHNPAGGWMIIALILSLSMTAFSGLKYYGSEGHGPLAVAGAESSQVQAQAIAAVPDNGSLASFFITPANASDDDDDDEHNYRAASGQDGDREHGKNEDHDEDEDEEGDEFWEEVHEFFANLTLLLIILHIAGVVISSYRHRVSLLSAMFTGYKPRQE